MQSRKRTRVRQNKIRRILVERIDKRQSQSKIRNCFTNCEPITSSSVTIRLEIRAQLLSTHHFATILCEQEFHFQNRSHTFPFMPLNLNCLRQSQIKLNFARVKKRSNSNVSTCSLYIFLYYQTNPQIVTLINYHYRKTGMFFFHEAETLPLTFFLNFSAAAEFSQKSFKPRNENKGNKNFTSFLFS